jgi:predicted transcriptional regulator of viral defense system
MTTVEHILQDAKKRGLIRPRDLEAQGIPHSYLQQLYEQGALIRSGRGIYMLSDWEPSETLSLAEACSRVPAGVVCLLSALRYHGIGTQDPRQVWMAIHPKARRPSVDYPPLRIVRFSGPALEMAVEEHPSPEGVLRVYEPARTIIDCFRYRNKVGLDVAMEALRDAWHSRKVTMDDLWHYAQALRMRTVIKPYLESLV